MKKHKVVILTNERPNDDYLWKAACEKRKEELDYVSVDLTSSQWLEEISAVKYDYLLVKPSCQTNPFKQLFDERLGVLVNELGYKSFPTYNEVMIYENKRYFSFWLKAHKLPHPQTEVFYLKNEALDYIKKVHYPLVGKLNIGASGHGIDILNSVDEATSYLNKMFGSGKTSRTGPQLGKGKLVKRAINKLLHPSEALNRLKIYKSIAGDVQKGYVILQEFIPHEYEWRVVRIGGSFFAHKKLKKKEKASGTLLKGYENPPKELLSFVKRITDKFGFYSQAVDVFEPEPGKFLINEMQCIFGQSDPYQMLVDGKPGRYIHQENKWKFEEGDFCTNQCFDLRLDYVINRLKKNKSK